MDFETFGNRVREDLAHRGYYELVQPWVINSCWRIINDEQQQPSPPSASYPTDIRATGYVYSSLVSETTELNDVHLWEDNDGIWIRFTAGVTMYRFKVIYRESDNEPF